MMEKWFFRVEMAHLERLAKQRPALVVTGARQTGKTSLARHTFPGYGYVTLDLPSEAAQAEGDPESFLRRHPLPLIVDEVQYAPGLFRHLKAVIDSNREAKGRIILTGSQRFDLMREVSDSLAGRVGLVELEGLALSELRESGLTPDPESLAVRGTMPELWQQPDLDAREYYRAYVTTYLERDLRILLDVGSLRDFERFLRACALRSAQVLNKAELARDIGISPSTAGAWLSALEASNQIRLLEPWFTNGTKTLVKSPKLYLCDPGLLCYFLGVRDRDDLSDSPYAGAVWETLVFSELRKQTRWQERGDLYYWRDRTKEADFLIHRAGRFEIFDAKWTGIPTSKDAGSLRKVAAELPEGSVRNLSLVCRTRHAFPLADGVRAVPVEEA